ncbi:prephenate dehydrogenase [Streptomyces alkaliterrae]|uniref:Prephenate dehydrogenase n=1 Tax=Streptomyces alkaliterrae TaxID=2213162 RepID=A0A5P0YL87_9ACTN|nr:prephenate dehydrogenase [Streptomyces alkaliterrae]MBB1259573.1 prephenate dehydrogenase [Streptomyces alkaliterrae]MQS01001.1 prephenate dehydrogenase/arogenate dehydrogenase family protein [Streptomyces alkaliterrae]
MRSVVVVGAGLIGTSVGLALTARGVTTHLLDRDPRVARAAAALGAGRTGRPRRPADLAVLAVPPGQVARVLAAVQGEELARIYTDVASVKEVPLTHAAEAGCDLARFVGGHPMAGRETSGPEGARRDLFRGRPWVLTPSARSGGEALDTVLELVALCGARPVVMGHREHDRAVALTSHTPHLVASLLAGTLLRGESDELRLAGQGLRDTTRVAAGDPDLWTDILGDNAEAVLTVLDALHGDLSLAREALRDLARGGPTARPDAAARLRAVLERGVRGRARVPTPGRRPAENAPRVPDAAVSGAARVSRPSQMALPQGVRDGVRPVA